MAKAENTEVAKKATTEVSLAVNFEADVGGFDEMGQDDLALPFLRILTNMSPEIGEIDGASPGMVYNSVTSELHDGKAGIQVVPCVYERKYIEWAPRGSGSGGPANIYPATSDILSRTHKEPGDNKDYLDNGNYIENTANYYVMYLDKDGIPSPALIVMKSTQLKKSRKWNSMMQSVKMQGSNGLFTPPMFSQIYRMTIMSESNDKGKWHGWEIEKVGAVEDAGVYETAKSFAASIKAGEVKAKPQEENAKEEGKDHNIF